MKKKIFRQRSVILYILYLLLAAIIGASIYVLIELFKSNFIGDAAMKWLGFIAALFAIAYCGYTIIRFMCCRIVFNESEIFVPGHRGDQKIQHEAHIRYRDIKNISLTAGSRDSKGRSVSGVFVQMPYILFEEYGGDTVAVNVYYYSKRQAAAIIDLAVARAKEQGNALDIKPGEELIREFLDSLKRKRAK